MRHVPALLEPVLLTVSVVLWAVGLAELAYGTSLGALVLVQRRHLKLLREHRALYEGVRQIMKEERDGEVA